MPYLSKNCVLKIGLTIFIVSSFFCLGCVHTSNQSVALTTYLKIPMEYKVDLFKGHCEILESNNDYNTYLIKFESLRGGQTFFLGQIKTKDVDGNKADRLFLHDTTSQTSIQFSVYDIMAIEKDTLSLDDLLTAPRK